MSIIELKIMLEHADLKTWYGGDFNPNVPDTGVSNGKKSAPDSAAHSPFFFNSCHQP